MMRSFIYGALLLLFSGCSGGGIRLAETLSHAEKIVAEAPDSVLRLLRELPTDALRSRELRARYALLQAEAAERAGTPNNNDSILRIAWEYYRKHPHEIRGICKTLYYRGQSRLRQGDKPGALRLFLEVEEKLRPIDEPYYLGLLYLRIGGVYRAELNFVRAYRYYRDARDLFIRSDAARQTTEAQLGMTVSALRMRDLGRALRDCSMALERADELRDDTLVRRSLALFATIYTVAESERIPDDLLRRIETSIHDRIHGLPRRNPRGTLPGCRTDDRPFHLPERLADPNGLAGIGRDDRTRLLPRTRRIRRLPDAEPPSG